MNDFSEKGQKNGKKKGKKMLQRGKKGQNIWKFGQKCTKFENILKRAGDCVHDYHMLERALIR